jgi:hypothetical protein
VAIIVCFLQRIETKIYQLVLGTFKVFQWFKRWFFSKNFSKEDLYVIIEIVLHNFQANKQAIINKKTIILLNNGRELVAVDLVQILYIEFQQN